MNKFKPYSKAIIKLLFTFLQNSDLFFTNSEYKNPLYEYVMTNKWKINEVSGLKKHYISLNRYT